MSGEREKTADDKCEIQQMVFGCKILSVIFLDRVSMTDTIFLKSSLFAT